MHREGGDRGHEFVLRRAHRDGVARYCRPTYRLQTGAPVKFVVRKLPMPPLIAVVMALPPVPLLIAWNVAVVPVVPVTVAELLVEFQCYRQFVACPVPGRC